MLVVTANTYTHLPLCQLYVTLYNFLLQIHVLHYYLGFVPIYMALDLYVCELVG